MAFPDGGAAGRAALADAPAPLDALAEVRAKLLAERVAELNSRG